MGFAACVALATALLGLALWRWARREGPGPAEPLALLISPRRTPPVRNPFGPCPDCRSRAAPYWFSDVASGLYVAVCRRCAAPRDAVLEAALDFTAEPVLSRFEIGRTLH